MAERGQRIEGIASAIEFIETTAESGGERVVVEISYAGTGDRPPVHFHPSQTEHFEVLEGEIHAAVDGTERVLSPGDELTIPPGTEHEMWATVPSRQRWTTMPALRTESFFETLWGLQQDGRAGDDGMPSKLQMALSLNHFKQEFRLANPPPAVQAVVFGALSVVARARGLSPTYRPRA